MSDRGNQVPGRRAHLERAERLAEALRANLKRRKAQARGRADRPEGGETGKDQLNRSDADLKGG